jgi:hypothetical protein
VSSARRLYHLNVIVAALGTAAVVASAAVAVTRVRPTLPSPDELLDACRGIVPVAGSNPAMLLVLGLAALGLSVAAFAARSLTRQLLCQRRFLRALTPTRGAEVCGHRVTVINDRRPQAFCAGLLRPSIYISEGALGSLSAVELRAVIAHEAHHRARRDPLRILLLGALADGLFFLPGLRRLGRRYGELAELAADEAATVKADPSVLASALLAFGERDGVDAVVGIAPERVDHLLGEPPRWQLPLSLVAGSLVTLLALFAIVASVPVLIREDSVSFAMLAAEGCMAAMVTLPIAVAAFAFTLSRKRLRRARA